MNKAYCLDCDRSIQVREDAELGDEILCPYCDAEFSLIGLNPPEIEWAYEDDSQSSDEDDDDWADDDEFEDDEENDNYSWRIAKQRRLQSTEEERRRAYPRED